jgi:hydroxymethylpyrimidine/phosphomethylpyrimidine kinase
MKTYPRLLSIAGSDCSGGAGIQADLKTASACGVYAMTAITAVVDENTVGVTGIHSIPVPMVLGQIRSCLDDIGADAIKIGMLDSPDLISAIADLLSSRYPTIPVVLDPVMVAQSGDPLVPPDAASALRALLVPHATVITPNLPEASVLLDRPIPTPADALSAARDLLTLGCPHALVKGGHFEDGATSDDILASAGDPPTVQTYPAPRIPTRNNHGTGCTLSSAIASHIALGHPVTEAVSLAKDYITGAIRAGSTYAIGRGHGPVHHFWRLWTAPLP